jgi:hypothetical protein
MWSRWTLSCRNLADLTSCVKLEQTRDTSDPRRGNDLVDSYKLGVNSYIQKPMDLDQFRQTVKSLGLYWRVVNRLPPDKTFS